MLVKAQVQALAVILSLWVQQVVLQSVQLVLLPQVARVSKCLWVEIRLIQFLWVEGHLNGHKPESKG
jgi:hypothetical protein